MGFLGEIEHLGIAIGNWVCYNRNRNKRRKGYERMAKEMLFSDMGGCFGPKTGISPFGRKDKWRQLPYRTGTVSGTMLSSLNEGAPETLSFEPQLEGWYKIYVCVPTFPNLEVHLKLSADESFFKICPLRQEGLTFTQVEESFWRYAKMDGQAVILSKDAISPNCQKTSILTWLRFVPMTQEEVERVLEDRCRQDTKCLYVTDDIHNKLFEGNIDSPDFWGHTVIAYEDSDAQWLSMERITSFVSGSCPDGDVENQAFLRPGDRGLQQQRDAFHSPAVMKELVRMGQQRGLKMSVSLRMGAWGIGFPFDQCYFDYDPYLENPHLRCVMRDGVPAAALSYAFEEVQQWVIDMLLEMAQSGCDAVTLIAHRGIPYVLYEEPVARRFREVYGEDPYDLPLDDPRLNGIHCQIMTEFFRKVRKALDAAYPDRHVQVHLRGLFSIYDSQYVGLDVRTLAKEGLLDAIISYPNRYREVYGEGCVKADGRIDMERYKAYVNDPHSKPYIHNGDAAFFPPASDSRGVLQGPVSVAQQVEQWMALEKMYNVPVYIDILPRVMPPEELRQRALELYEAGAERFALWDTFGRVTVKGMWSVARKLGHRKELEAGFDPEYRLFRLQELAGNDISRYLPVWGG